MERVFFLFLLLDSGRALLRGSRARPATAVPPAAARLLIEVAGIAAVAAAAAAAAAAATTTATTVAARAATRRSATQSAANSSSSNRGTRPRPGPRPATRAATEHSGSSSGGSNKEKKDFSGTFPPLKTTIALLPAHKVVTRAWKAQTPPPSCPSSAPLGQRSITIQGSSSRR